MPTLAPARRRSPQSDRSRRAGGKPTEEELLSIGDPPDGTRMSHAEFNRRTLEFRCELVDGKLDYLGTMARDLHGMIVRFLNRAFDAYLLAQFPDALLQGQHIRIRIRRGRSRDPDVVVLLNPNHPGRGPDEWEYADLCVEVVSPDDPDRDYVDKRRDYAAAGVPEYWIVDPRDRTDADPRGRTVRVLSLAGGEYSETVFEEGETAAGAVLPGFAVDVTACLAGA